MEPPETILPRSFSAAAPHVPPQPEARIAQGPGFLACRDRADTVLLEVESYSDLVDEPVSVTMVRDCVAGRRVLVMDEAAADRAILADAIALDGIIVARAADAADALALSAAFAFDLAAVALPRAAHDPLHLVGPLRAASPGGDVPLILIAEPGHADLVCRGFDLGASDWLLKPLDTEEVRARVRSQLRRKIKTDQLRVQLGHAQDLALTDGLTGTFNRRYLARHLRGLLRPGRPHGLCVLMVDIDDFKVVNDRWGHAAGDTALKAVASALRRGLGAFDVLARYGGEEFAAVLPDTPAADATDIADRVRAVIDGMHFAPAPGAVHHLTVSIGVACSGDRDTTGEHLLHEADQALYRAKRSGRNRVELAAISDAAGRRATCPPVVL